MSEAVWTVTTAFAPRSRGAYPARGEHLAPDPTMSIPLPTSSLPGHLAVRCGRRGRLALAGALVAVAVLCATPAAEAWTGATSFRIMGHGWGHGIGMSQWGAYGYAKHGWAYKAILKHYYTGIAFGQRSNVDIRVNLRSGLGAVKVTCPYAFTATGTAAPLQIPAGRTATTTFSGKHYHVVAGDVKKDFSAPVTFAPTKGSLRILTATDLGDTGAYRGVIRVVRPGKSGSSLMMINRVPLESYLRGSVPHEVSPSWPAESLKAQACAARAFALGSRKPGKAWDVYCDVRSQAYMGIGIEDSHTDAAVRATAGVTPTYKGSVILAVYSSCSGGHTENIEFGWPGSSPLGYLKGVSDPYDYYGSLHDWGPVRRTAAQLAGPLGAKGSLRSIYTVRRGTSPRIVKAAVIGSGGVTFMDGNTLRMKLNLNSTWAVFTSMSINPAASNHVSIAPGGGLTLKGRIYPALPDGANVRLHFSYGGESHSRVVATVRASQSLGGGYTAKYSTYSSPISPAQTTDYWFASGKAKSPVTTITVK
jgi:stage II sporulation protein D